MKGKHKTIHKQNSRSRAKQTNKKNCCIKQIYANVSSLICSIKLAFIQRYEPLKYVREQCGWPDIGGQSVLFGHVMDVLDISKQSGLHQTTMDNKLFLGT